MDPLYVVFHMPSLFCSFITLRTLPTWKTIFKFSWNQKRFKKTFHTATSGLPECLFNTGYSKFNAYSTSIRNHYDDSISWAFVNKVHIIEDYEGDQVETKVEDSLAFLKGMKLIFNDGSGDKELIAFESIDFVDGMQQKCRIRK